MRRPVKTRIRLRLPAGKASLVRFPACFSLLRPLGRPFLLPPKCPHRQQLAGRERGRLRPIPYRNRGAAHVPHIAAGFHNVRMPNLSTAFRSEVTRLARKEMRAQLEALQRVGGEQRKQIGELKKAVVALQRQVRQLERAVDRQATAPTSKSDDEERDLRWRRAGFAAHRRRLDLTAAQMGRLLGCSARTIAAWEEGRARPDDAQLVAIAGIRRLSKAAARTALDAVA